MSDLIRYGRIETFTVDNGILVVQEETIHDFTTRVNARRFTANVLTDDTKTLTAEALKLIDKLKDETVSEISMEVKKRKENSRYKMAVSWVVR